MISDVSEVTGGGEGPVREKTWVCLVCLIILLMAEKSVRKL